MRDNKIVQALFVCASHTTEGKMNPGMNSTNAPELINVRGIVSSGVGKSKLFTGIPWVRRQFIDKLGINPYPGTFNVTVLPEDRKGLNVIKNTKGVEIVPEDENFCAANSFPALVNGRIRGAVIIPLVPCYPQAKLEIISAEHIKGSLSLKDGDLVNIEIRL